MNHATPRRATLYSPQLGQEIAKLYAAGHSMQDIAELGAWVPGPTTLTEWKSKHPEFAKLMADAEALRADSLIEQTLSIADNTFDPALANVRIKTRQFIAGKLNRAKYGEKVEVSHTLTLDMGAILAEAEARLVTSAAANRQAPQLIDVTPQSVDSLEALLS